MRKMLIRFLSYLQEKLDNQPCEITEEEMKELENEIKEFLG